MAHVLRLQIPKVDDEIKQAIQASKSILDLEDDWDGEGSIAYSEATWKRATDFVWKNAMALWDSCECMVSAPRITPGPSGSIDLYWETDSHELLVNIPAAEDQPATYYGERQAGEVLKGSLIPSSRNQWLMMWLTE
jgi:hypothetical protein